MHTFQLLAFFAAFESAYGRLRSIALIDDPEVIYRILKQCDLLGTEPDARPPPHEPIYIPCEFGQP